MRDGDDIFSIANPAKQMDEAYAAWVFSVQLWATITTHAVDLKAIPRKIALKDGATLGLFKSNLEERYYADFAFNIFLACTGMCAIAFDAAMDAAFGTKDRGFPSVGSPDVLSARAILFQMRNAFAHTPTMPRWSVTNPQYRRTFRVEACSLELDLAGLNGRDLSIQKDFGGWDTLRRLFVFCIDRVRENDSKTGTLRRT